MILKRFVLGVIISLALVGCGETVRVSSDDHAKKMAEIDRKLKIAKENTKKAEEDLKKTEEGLKETKEQLKKTQEKMHKATGDEKTKLEKAADDLAKKLVESDKTIKKKMVQMNLTLLDTVDQSDSNKRKEAYESLPKREYKGDILMKYFAGGDKPKEQDLQLLDYSELTKIEKDLFAVVMALHAQ